MACTCKNINCTQEVVSGVTMCTCTTVINDVTCPEGCVTIINLDGSANCECTEYAEAALVGIKKPVYFDNENYFEDVSWTISYNPTEGSWGSYFSFKPDYSPFHNNFFQVGYNWGQDKGTLWNHTMDNSSFQVFQGRLYPFIIEYPVQNENVNKVFNSLSLNIESKRYQNQWDYSQWEGIGFNKLTIFNNTNNSGVLRLNEQKNLRDIKNYPKNNSDNTQDILFVPTEDKQIVNYFYNRVSNQNNNLPLWLWDKNMINKTVNPKAVTFKNNKNLERLKGTDFLINLTNDKESRFKILLKNSTTEETVYE